MLYECMLIMSDLVGEMRQKCLQDKVDLKLAHLRFLWCYILTADEVCSCTCVLVFVLKNDRNLEKTVWIMSVSVIYSTIQCTVCMYTALNTLGHAKMLC